MPRSAEKLPKNTPFSLHNIAFVWHDRKTGEAVLEAFRQETCPDAEFTARMPFLQPEQSYTLTNEDTGEQRVLSGAALASEGLVLTLDEPKSSAVWHILPTE